MEFDQFLDGCGEKIDAAAAEALDIAVSPKSPKIMLTYLKRIIHSLLPSTLYFSCILVVLYTISKDSIIGISTYIFLIPQPNIWKKFYKFPLGNNYLDLLFVAIVISLLVYNKKFKWTNNSYIIIFFILMSYISLWVSSFNFALPVPISLNSVQLYEWKNYFQMISLYFLIIPFAKNEKYQKIFFLIITITLLIISIRNLRNFSAGSEFNWSKRAGGPFESVGLGANHFGAFIAFYGVTILGMSFFAENIKEKVLFITTYFLSLHPLLFSYSRGAYLGAIASIIFLGIKKSKILIAILILIISFWTVILPVSVVDRISMTTSESGEFESSTEERFKLWGYAYEVISRNPILGSGWGGFGLSLDDNMQVMSGSTRLTDTHNFYLKMLCNQGIIGFGLFLVILMKAYLSGNCLYSNATSHFHKGLALGFMGTVIAVSFANLTGDRFSYFVLGSYFWLLWGMVDAAILSVKTPPPGKRGADVRD